MTRIKTAGSRPKFVLAGGINNVPGIGSASTILATKIGVNETIKFSVHAAMEPAQYELRGIKRNSSQYFVLGQGVLDVGENCIHAVSGQKCSQLEVIAVQAPGGRLITDFRFDPAATKGGTA